MIYTDKIHLISDKNLNELHEFAKKINLNYCNFSNHKIKHYDLLKFKVTWKDAVKAGAVLTSTKILIKNYRKIFKEIHKLNNEKLVKFIKFDKNTTDINSNVKLEVSKNEILSKIKDLQKYDIEIKEPFYMTIGCEHLIIIPNWIPIKKIIKLIKFNWKNKWYLDDNDKIQIDKISYPFGFNFSKLFKELHVFCI